MQVSIISPAASPAKLESQRRLQCGLAGMAYYNGFLPVLNWWKAHGFYTVTRSNGADMGLGTAASLGYCDTTTGELVSPLPAEVTSIKTSEGLWSKPPGNWAGLGADYAGESFTVLWDGTATVTISGTVTNVVKSAGSATFDLDSNPSSVALTFAVTDWNNPPTNIRVYQTRYANDMTIDGVTYPGYLNGGKFNPHWLAEMRNFKTIRFMDLNRVNGNTAVYDAGRTATEAYQSWSVNGGTVGKGGFPHSLICKAASLTGCNVHICVPHLVTDAGMADIAQIYADYMDAHPGETWQVHVEYSNECWNSAAPFNVQKDYCDSQGGAAGWTTGVSFAKGRQWYGYRAAQLLKIWSDTLGAGKRARWRGVIGAWLVSSDATNNILVGINKFLTDNTLGMSDLFDELAVTGYFGDVRTCSKITAISRANPGVVTTESAHGLSTGAQVIIGVHPNDGMPEVNNQIFTATVLTSTTFSIGVDTTAYTAFVGGTNAYFTSARIFNMATTSAALNASDPTTYPSPYTYLRQQVAKSLLTGTCEEGFTTGESISKLWNTYWPANKSIADANGLDFVQYEGGCHFVGDGYLTGYYGSNEVGFRFYALCREITHSTEVGAVYAAMYDAFEDIGGKWPAKYVEGGTPSVYGSWGGVRYWPFGSKNDIDRNPVWKATVASSKMRFDLP